MIEETNLLSQLQEMLHWKKSKKFYCDKLNISEEYLEELLKELKNQIKPNYMSEKPVEQTTRVNEEKGTLESTLEVSFDPQTVEQLAKLHKIDLTKYKISNYWSKLKSNGKFTSSVFATLRKPKDYTPEDFSKFLTTWEPLSIKIDLMEKDFSPETEIVDIELNLADFHLAKRSFQKDTVESKTFDYYKIVNELVTKVKNSYIINKLVFPISNDFFHSDNYQNTTTAGTPQDVTVWYDEEYEKGFDILANTINYLLTQAKEVEVILVQGNHDRTKSFYVAHALEIFFKGYKNVKFQRHHSVTKHTVVGNTFIGYHHGNCKLESLPLIFAASPDTCKDFANAKYREIHTGDKHHYMAKEVNGTGVRIQQLPSLSMDDRWHVDNGFINQIRAGIAFVYHPNKGKIAEFEERI